MARAVLRTDRDRPDRRLQRLVRRSFEEALRANDEVLDIVQQRVVAIDSGAFIGRVMVPSLMKDRICSNFEGTQVVGRTETTVCDVALMSVKRARRF